MGVTPGCEQAPVLGTPPLHSPGRPCARHATAPARSPRRRGLHRHGPTREATREREREEELTASSPGTRGSATAALFPAHASRTSAPPSRGELPWMRMWTSRGERGPERHARAGVGAPPSRRARAAAGPQRARWAEQRQRRRARAEQREAGEVWREKERDKNCDAWVPQFGN